MQRSERVKGVEIHPTEPWLLTNLYNGSVVIWDYQNNAVVKSFEVSELPGELSANDWSNRWRGPICFLALHLCLRKRCERP